MNIYIFEWNNPIATQFVFEIGLYVRLKLLIRILSNHSIPAIYIDQLDDGILSFSGPLHDRGAKACIELIQKLRLEFEAILHLVKNGALYSDNNETSNNSNMDDILAIRKSKKNDQGACSMSYSAVDALVKLMSRIEKAIIIPAPIKPRPHNSYLRIRLQAPKKMGLKIFPKES